MTELQNFKKQFSAVMKRECYSRPCWTVEKRQVLLDFKDCICKSDLNVINYVRQEE